MSGMLDLAIAAHPAAWRARYGDEVRGTLLDVADDHNGRLPLAETLPLAARGLWLRARRSVAFWGSLVIATIMVSSAFMVDAYYMEGSTTAYALALNLGLGYALLVVAIVAGWAGARTRIASTHSVQRLWRESWPLLAVVVASHGVAFGILSIRWGAPWAAWPTPLVLLGQLAAVLGAIAIGELLGAVLPRVLVIFAAPIAVGVALIAVSRWNFYSGIAYTVEPAPVLAVAVIAAALAVLCVLASTRVLWLRAAAAAIAAGVLVGGVMWPVAAPNAVARDEAELVCSTVEPVVCLWPEQEASFGASHREAMSTAYERAKELGLPVGDEAPRSVAQYSLTGIGAREGTSGENAAEFGLGVTGLRPAELNLYAIAMSLNYASEPQHGQGQRLQLTHAIAIALGVPAEQSWITMPDPYTGQVLLDPADAPDEQQSLALIEKWLEDGLDGVPAPR
jgi:hypothetical protein